MQAGIKGTYETTVTDGMTAANMKSGALPVLATPMMIACMENVCFESIGPHLEPGQGTVGVKVDVAHLAPTPVGAAVRFECELVEVDRKRLVFAVKAYDEAGLIGEGRHERFIIDNQKFINRLQKKFGGAEK